MITNSTAARCAPAPATSECNTQPRYALTLVGRLHGATNDSPLRYHFYIATAVRDVLQEKTESLRVCSLAAPYNRQKLLLVAD